MADSEYLPPVIAEIILRTQGFSAGAAKVRAEMDATAAGVGTSAQKMGSDFDKGASKVEQRSEGMSKRVGNAMQTLGWSIGGAAGRPLEAFGTQIERADTKAKGLIGTLNEVGKVATVGGLVGFAGAAYEGVKAANAFQTSLAQIAADSNQVNAQAIGKAFLGTMGQSAFSANQLASAYAQVSQQLKVVEGHALSAKDAMGVMTASTDLAEGAQTNLGTATQAIAQVMRAYHLTVGQAAQAADSLYSVSRATGSGIDSIAQAMGRLHARLGIVMPSMRDVGGLMVAAAQTGLTGSRGILQMSSALQTLLGGGAKTQAVLAALHVNLRDANGQFVGMGPAIGMLHSALAGVSPQMQLLAANTLFGKGAAETMLQIIDKGPASFAREAAAADRSNAAHKAAEAQSKTFAHQIEVLKATLEDLATSLGTFLIPIIGKVSHAISDVIGWFEKGGTAAQILEGVIVGVLGSAMTVFAYQKVTAFVGALGKMGGALLGLLPNFGEVATAATTTAGVVEGAEAGMADATVASAGVVDAAIGSTGIGLIVIGLGVAISELALHWTDAWNGIKSITQTVTNFIIDRLNNIINAYNSLFGWLTGNIARLGHENLFGNGPTQNPAWRGQASTLNAGAFDRSLAKSGTLTTGQGITASDLMQAFIHAGLSPAGAAAFVGNWTQESGLNPNYNNRAVGVGMGQWTNSRADALKAFAAKNHEAWNSPQTQADFALSELSSRGGPLVGILSTTRDPRQAALAISNLYEQPQGTGKYGGSGPYAPNLDPVANLTRREGVAAAVYKAYMEYVKAAKNAGATGATGGAAGAAQYAAGAGSSAAQYAALQQALGMGKKASPATALESIIKNLQSAAQTGSAPSLEGLLGTQLSKGVSAKLHSAIVAGDPLSTLTNILQASAKGSGAQGKYEAELAKAKAIDPSLVPKLVAAHTQAMNALAKALETLQAQKDAAQIALQATQMADQNKLALDTAQGQQSAFDSMVTQLKASGQQVLAQQLSDSQKSTVAGLAPLGISQNDASSQVISDYFALTSQQTQAATQQITDATAVMQAQITAFSTNSQDAIQSMADATSATVQGMQDQTQIQADTLGERGLYGFGLIAQQLQVQLDVLKSGFDGQIDAARQNVDATKATWDATIGLDQTNVAQVTAAQDLLVQAAQQHATTVQLREDVLVQAAQQHADSVQLSADTKTAIAQNAVTLSASASQAQQHAAAAQLALAQAQGNKAETQADNLLRNTQSAAADAERTANAAYQSAQDNAQAAIAAANSQLTADQYAAAKAEADANKTLQTIQDTASVAEQGVQDQITIAQAQEAALQRGGGTFNPYTSLVVGANGQITFTGGTLPNQGAAGGGGVGQMVNNFNVNQQVDTPSLAQEMMSLLQPYLTSAPS